MTSLRIVTFNVRYATEKPVPNEQPWKVRCPKLCTQLQFITSGHESVFVCLQEVLYSQLQDIQSMLGDEWAHIGHGRADGKQSGEFSPIFYRVGTWRCERNKTYWLSETPEQPSKGWDAALNRVVTVGQFRHTHTGTRVVAMSTHFDHRGAVAREKSAEFLLKLADQWNNGTDGQAPAALLLGGDFNSTPDGKAYKTMVARGSGMADVSTRVPSERRYGNDLTYTSFGEPGERAARIDFLFVKEPNTVKVSTFAVLANRFDDGLYLSDHRPVVADMDIPIAAGNSS